MKKLIDSRHFYEKKLDEQNKGQNKENKVIPLPYRFISIDGEFFLDSANLNACCDIYLLSKTGEKVAMFVEFFQSEFVDKANKGHSSDFLENFDFSGFEDFILGASIGEKLVLRAQSGMFPFKLNDIFYFCSNELFTDKIMRGACRYLTHKFRDTPFIFCPPEISPRIELLRSENGDQNRSIIEQICNSIIKYANLYGRKCKVNNIFIVLNPGQIHWTYTNIDLSQRSFELYDSYGHGRNNRSFASKLETYLPSICRQLIETSDKFNLTPQIVEKRFNFLGHATKRIQNDGVSCGPFVFFSMEEHAKHGRYIAGSEEKYIKTSGRFKILCLVVDFLRKVHK